MPCTKSASATADDRGARGRIGMRDRLPRPDFGDVRARIGARDDRGRDRAPLRRVRQRRREVAARAWRTATRRAPSPSPRSPTVEPIARCALMMPDAMPARSRRHRRHRERRDRRQAQRAARCRTAPRPSEHDDRRLPCTADDQQREDPRSASRGRTGSAAARRSVPTRRPTSGDTIVTAARERQDHEPGHLAASSRARSAGTAS